MERASLVFAWKTDTDAGRGLYQTLMDCAINSGVKAYVDATAHVSRDLCLAMFAVAGLVTGDSDFDGTVSSVTLDLTLGTLTANSDTPAVVYLAASGNNTRWLNEHEVVAIREALFLKYKKVNKHE